MGREVESTSPKRLQSSERWMHPGAPCSSCVSTSQSFFGTRFRNRYVSSELAYLRGTTKRLEGSSAPFPGRPPRGCTRSGILTQKSGIGDGRISHSDFSQDT